jgi:hypothetical protein
LTPTGAARDVPVIGRPGRGAPCWYISLNRGEDGALPWPRLTFALLSVTEVGPALAYAGACGRGDESALATAGGVPRVGNLDPYDLQMPRVRRRRDGAGAAKARGGHSCVQIP